MPSFQDLPLLESLKLTLQEKLLTKPTEIQQKTIPALLDGKSVVGVSETGSGKTLAYVLPMLHLLKTDEDAGRKVKEDSAPRGIVIVPARDLGEQVSKVFKTFTHTTRLRVRTVLGGTTMEVAKDNTKGPFEILVATPGRLALMLTKKQINLKDVRFVVFDEADQMLDESFMNDAEKILERCPEELQIALFSATVSVNVEKLMGEIFEGAVVYRTAGASRVPASLKTQNRNVLNGKRMPLLETVLKEKSDGGTLIFANTREQCDELASELDKKGIKAVIYRGEMDKVERRSNLREFREGEVEILISTDLASRGLDVEHIGRVINYHMPQHLENYLHRVGRTARAGRPGLVINFVTERDVDIVKELEKVRFIK